MRSNLNGGVLDNLLSTCVCKTRSATNVLFCVSGFVPPYSLYNIVPNYVYNTIGKYVNYNALAGKLYCFLRQGISVRKWTSVAPVIWSVIGITMHWLNFCMSVSDRYHDNKISRFRELHLDACVYLLMVLNVQSGILLHWNATITVKASVSHCFNTIETIEKLIRSFVCSF